MPKMEFDAILRCANASCSHNRDGYFCMRSVIALNGAGQCALYRPKPAPKNTAIAPNKSKPAPFDVEASE